MNNTSSDEHRYTLISVEKAPERASETVSENAPEKAPEKMPDNVFENVPKKASDNAFDNIPNNDVPAAEESVRSLNSNKKAEPSSESALDNLTEEDLKSSAPLENVHKILITVLILGLVAFGLYFVLFR